MKHKICLQLGRWLLFLCFLLLTGAQSLQAEVTAEATINVRSFPLDRAAILSIIVKGTDSFQPEMPAMEGIRFHQRGQSTQRAFINGDYSVSVTSTYLVEALQEGEFTIPPIIIHFKEGSAETQPVTFTVLAPDSVAVPSQSQSGSSGTARLRSGEAEKVAFMRVEPVKVRSYSGEMVPVRVKAYFRDGIKANLNSLPQLVGEGFVLQQLGREPAQSREVVNNTRYTVLTWDSVLSGIKEGDHKLSMEIEATLLLREQGRSRRPRSMFSDPFFGDSFFDDFFGSYREKEVKVASPEIDMAVLPLPEKGRPESFSGAIGDFSIQVTAEPLELEPGDPITLTMTVSGQGNFDRVQAPKLSEEKGWKTYTPSSEFLEAGKGAGKKVFEQALVARDPGLRAIPAVVFSYFDPDSGEYRSVSSDPIPFTIHGQEPVAGALSTAVKKEEETTETSSPGDAAPVDPHIKGLAPLQLEPGDMDEDVLPLFTKRWFQILLALIFLALVLGGAYKVRAARYARNPRLQRNQAMQGLLAVRLEALEQSLAARDSRGFLATCRQAIQEQLGLIWEVEGGAITLADLQERLPADSPLLAIFRAAEESVFGGTELSSEQMQEFADWLKRELEGLR